MDDRQCDLKYGPAPGGALHINLSTMLRDYLLDYSQAESGSPSAFGRKQRIENQVDLIFRNPFAAVRQFDDYGVRHCSGGD
jgi:hypothetical protein